MTEGGVLIATWERIRSGYRVWARDEPALVAEGVTFAEADEKLWHVIGMATGDGENQREYTPPPPPDPGTPSGVPHVWELGIEPRAFMFNADVLFDGGLCASCLMPRGPRSSVALRVQAIDDGVDVSRVEMPRRRLGAGPSLSVYSDRFLALLPPDEQKAFTWRPLDIESSGARSFYVLIPGLVVPYVTVKGRSARFRMCGECGWKWALPQAIPGLPFLSISSAEVAVPSEIMAVHNNARARLAVFEPRWTELVGREGTRGIKGTIVGVIPEADAERDPEYQLRTPEPPIKEKAKR